MIIDGNNIRIQRWQIEEILEHRISKFKVKIQDLFMVLPSPNAYEWDTFVETRFGKLRTFCVDPAKCSNDEGLPGARIMILHTSKFNYPQISPFNNLIQTEEKMVN